MPRVEGFIFDLDGTLLDTLDDIVDAGNSVLSQLGITPVDKEHYREFIGDGVNELFRKLLEYRKALSEENLQICVSLMKEAYSKNYLNKTRPYDGIYEMLDYLSRNNYKLSILSNKQHSFTNELVKHFFSNFKFVVVRGIESSEDRKPNPRLAIEIANTMGIPPQKIMFVGDSINDIITARTCEMIPVGVSWGFKSYEEILSYKPSYILNNPMDIIRILEEC